MPYLWQRLPNAANSRVNHQAVVLRDNVYIFGGYQKQFQGLDSPETTQVDVLCFCMRTSRWCPVAYPATCKLWNCALKTFTPLPPDEPAASPSLRFGHTVVPWRGRCWLFGGRSRFSACPSDLYLFDPNFCAAAGGAPFWARVEGIRGTPPDPRDGHASAVLEDAMFVFGGFNDQMETFENTVYRLDFMTWQWQTISLASGLLTQQPSPQHDVPTPRDFACLVAHRGRLFLFGGRSYASLQEDAEMGDEEASGVYESTLWELLPLANSPSRPTLATDKDADDPSMLWHACHTERIDHLAASYSLALAAWEEATGNWESSEPWHSAPPRPPCLWRHALERQSSHCRSADAAAAAYCCCKRPVASAWTSGTCVWRMLHPSTRPFECTDVLRRLHAAGLLSDQEFRRHQARITPTALLPHLLMCPPATTTRMSFGAASDLLSSSYPTVRDGPFGRRSMSSWAYDGNLYVAFGTLRSDTLRFKVYFNDVWRYSLEANQWFPVHYDHDDSQPAAAAAAVASGPSARRRAIAALHLPQPRPHRESSHPRVFVYGGTQPQRLNAVGARNRTALTVAAAAGDTVTHSSSSCGIGAGSNKELRTVASPPLTPRSLLLTAAPTSPPQPLDPLTSPILFVVIGDGDSSGFHLFATAPSAFLTNPLPTLCSYGGLLVFTSLTDLLTSPSNLSSDLASNAADAASEVESATATSLLRALQSCHSSPAEPNGDRRPPCPALFTLLLCEPGSDGGGGGGSVTFNKPPATADIATATAVCLRLVDRVATELAHQLPSRNAEEEEAGERPPVPAHSIRIFLPLEEATMTSPSYADAAAFSTSGCSSLQCCLRPSFFQVATTEALTAFVQSLSAVAIYPRGSTQSDASASPSSSLSLVEAGMESEEEEDEDMSILSSSVSSSSSSSSGSDAFSSPGGRRPGDRCAYVPTVGHVLRGRENLKMLNDVYVLHLEASLYQLCLSRVRGLFPILPNSALRDLPDTILTHLMSLY